MLVDITINLIIGTILTIVGFLINKYYLSKKPTLPPDILIDNSNTAITNATISLDNTYIHNYYHNHYYNNYQPTSTPNKQNTSTTFENVAGFFILGLMILAFAVIVYSKYSYHILLVCIWTSFFFVFLNSFMVAYALKNKTWGLKESKLKNFIIILLVFWLLVFITAVISTHSLFIPIEIIEVLKQVNPLPFFEAFYLLSSIDFSIFLYIAFLILGLSLILLLLLLLIFYQIISLIAWSMWIPLHSIKILWITFNITDLIIILSFFYLTASFFLSGILPNLLVKI